MSKSIAFLAVSALMTLMCALPVVATSANLDCTAAWNETSASNKCKISGLSRHSDTQCLVTKDHCTGHHGVPNFVGQVIIWSPKTETVDATDQGFMYVKSK